MDFDEMIAYAYAECGLSIDQFFALSWYEWSLEVHKARKNYERDHTKWEKNTAVIREFMAMFYNVNRGTNPTKTGKDLLPLSFDKPEASSIDELPSEAKDRLSMFPKTLKK